MEKSKLSAFLKPAKVMGTKELIISDRFLGKDGKPMPFEIRAISQGENEKLVKASTLRTKEKGQVVETFDRHEYMRRLVVAGTVMPKFDAPEMCEAYQKVNPLDVPGEMLLAGEFDRLGTAISDFSGFSDLADAGEEAKN